MVMDRRQQRRALLEAMSRERLAAMVETLEIRLSERDQGGGVDDIQAIIDAQARQISELEDIIRGQNKLLDRYHDHAEVQRGFISHLMEKP